jgi:hypothetical protein
MNYAAWETEDFHQYHQELEQILAEKTTEMAI